MKHIGEWTVQDNVAWARISGVQVEITNVDGTHIHLDVTGDTGRESVTFSLEPEVLKHIILSKSPVYD
jgi:hypothetical protein